MDKKIRKVNAKLYLEYLKFKDDMLRKTQEEVFKNCYKIDVFLNLYEILVEKSLTLSAEILVRLEKEDNILEFLYEGWMKIDDNTYQEMCQYVNEKLSFLEQKKAG